MENASHSDDLDPIVRAGRIAAKRLTLQQQAQALSHDQRASIHNTDANRTPKGLD
jgi:hypothetical protein